VAIDGNSYGSVAEVQAMVRHYTMGGLFTTETRPSLSQVETFIDRASALLNAVLARYGFTVPISQADAKLVCDDFTVMEVADRCEAANRTGRLMDRSLRGRSRFDIWMEDAVGFVEANATSLENLGAARPSGGLTQGLDYTATDDAGEVIEPIFDKTFMGQGMTDWDTA